MIAIDKNSWRRGPSGRPPEVLAVVFVDVHCGKAIDHVGRTRLSLEPRVFVQHSPQ